MELLEQLVLSDLLAVAVVQVLLVQVALEVAILLLEEMVVMVLQLQFQQVQ
jgi:hypothetical protein